MKMVKFAHLSDVHLGGWRNKVLSNLNFEAFKKAIKISLENNVKFILMSGDLFDVPLISIDILEDFTKIIKEVKEKKVPIFIIGGSHDFNHSQKSYLRIFDLLNIINLVDEKGVDYENFHISGISGKKLSLDKHDFFNKEIFPVKDKFNIFMFHINVKEITNNNFEGISINDLPKGFDYYAGGHIHKDFLYKKENKFYVFPGVLFPNNFKELKEVEPTFYIVDVIQNEKLFCIPKKIKLNHYEKEIIELEINDETPLSIYGKIIEIINKRNLKNKIVLLELKGIVDGRVSDIRITEIKDKIYEKGAMEVLQNTKKLKSKDLVIETDEINIDKKEFLKQLIKDIGVLEDRKKDKKRIIELFKLDLYKKDDEKEEEYKRRVFEYINKIFEDVKIVLK